MSLIPRSRYEGYVHVADWFATFATVAGVPGAASADDGTAPRPSDSIDCWAALTRQAPLAPLHQNHDSSVRTEIPLSIQMYGGPNTRPHPGWRIESGALILGRLKLVIGGQLGAGVHFYPA